MAKGKWVSVSILQETSELLDALIVRLTEESSRKGGVRTVSKYEAIHRAVFEALQRRRDPPGG